MKDFFGKFTDEKTSTELNLSATDSRLENSVDPEVSDDNGDLQIISQDRKKIGVVSALFLIVNRMVGTGIFATPASILQLTGSVGLSLIMWFVGMIFAWCGMLIYIEWGLAIPKNGGEKNYLEFVYKKPKYLVTCMYAMYCVLLGWAASNSVVFGTYILNAADVEVDRWNQRGIGLACVTCAFLIHGLALKWGLWLQNFLGIVKIVVILFITVTGWVALAGHMKIENPHNFRNAFEGTESSAYGIVTALYNVIWSYIGYSNANYALAEAKNPKAILRVAAPSAILVVSVLYMFCNIAYFAAISKEEILESGQIVAAIFFKNMFGTAGEKAISVLVALSAFGNVLSVIFSQGRIIQEFGREGILPFSKLWASNKPLNAPFMGLFEHWLVSVIIMLAPPPGDAYNFILNLISYPLAVVNTFVALGLLWVFLNFKKYQWKPSNRIIWPALILFLLSSLYLVIAPFVPPDTPEQNIYKSLPYWLHAVVGIGLFVAGFFYWAIWARLMPTIGNYKLIRRTIIGSDGWTRHVFVKIPNGEEVPSINNNNVETSSSSDDIHPTETTEESVIGWSEKP